MTEIAVQGLNGMAIGDKSLKVQKASIGITQVAGVEMGVNAMSMLAGTTSTDQEESRVVQLLNMVTAEELMDNDDYEGKSRRPLEAVCQEDTNECRNLRRRPRGVRKIWNGHGPQGSKTEWWKQAVGWCWQDLCQIRLD